MAFLSDDVLDAALDEVALSTVLHICSSEPATYAGVAGVSLGTKAAPAFTGPVNGAVNGRRLTVNQILDGDITGSGTASHFALVDATRLLAAGPLNANQVVTSGNTFTLTAFDVTFPDPA